LRRLPGRRFRCSTARARPEKGLFIACDDLKPARRFVVNSGTERYRVDAHTEAIGVRELAETLAATAAAPHPKWVHDIKAQTRRLPGP